MRVPAVFPWRALSRPLGPSQRAHLARQLESLVAWQRTLRDWPRPLVRAPDATPFVSLYVDGQVRGCIGCDDDAPGTRVARAFVRALGDARFAGVSSDERTRVVAEVSYPCGPFRVYRDPDEALAHIEPGTDGVVLLPPSAPPAVLLPQVARDTGFDAAALLGALSQKAGLPAHGWRGACVITFGAAQVDSRPRVRDTASSVDLAASWLARQVRRDGSVCFAVDPRTGRETTHGAMHHGRAAVLLDALATHGGHARTTARARDALARAIRAAAAGRPIAAWPDQPAVVGGTFALCARAGVPGALDAARAFAHQSPGATASPWHAAQLVAVLGRDAPARVYAVCVADLAQRPWSPWTTLAARARGDAVTLARCEEALCDALRTHGPHRGGADVTPVPATALTAMTVEALGSSRGSRARAAVERGRAFLRRWQSIDGAGLHAALDRSIAYGSFPASPVDDTLRCDVTAHALLALTPC